MSGLGNEQSTVNERDGSRVYLFIREGKIIKKVDDQMLSYAHLTGILKDIYVKYDGLYGPELHVTLRAEGVDYILQMRLDSGYARSFMKIAPNFDLAMPMSIFPSLKNKSEGRQETGMFIRQNGLPLKWYYTREKPNGLPELVPVKIKNPQTGVVKDGWDNTEQLKFLVDNLMVIKSMLPPASVIENKENIAAVQGAAASAISNDDLPF